MSFEMHVPDDLYERVPSDRQAWLAALALDMTIAGAGASGGERRTLFDPCTETAIATFPEADRGHLNRAVAAAKAAFPAWSARSWQSRRDCLERFTQAIEGAQRDMAIVLACESGRPLIWAWREINFAVHYLRILAAHELPPRDLSRPGLRAELKRKALGVVGAIAPWNAPVVLAIAKIANALLVGDTMVLRPSPFTPLTALQLGQLGRGIFPDGVFNVITGSAEIGAAMTSHPDVAKISFTGSTATGKAIAAAAAPTLKRLTLELGGNDAAILLPDADVAAVAATVYGIALVNCGHFCAAIKRLYVHEAIRMANDSLYGLGGSIWTRDVERGVALAEQLEVGTGWVNQHGAFTAALPMAFAKESGIGIDYAEYGLAEHARPMLINARL